MDEKFQLSIGIEKKIEKNYLKNRLNDKNPNFLEENWKKREKLLMNGKFQLSTKIEKKLEKKIILRTKILTFLEKNEKNRTKKNYGRKISTLYRDRKKNLKKIILKIVKMAKTPTF